LRIEQLGKPKMSRPARPTVSIAATEVRVAWGRDSIDSRWHIAKGIGSVRSSASYGKAGGWWFLPEWLPDSEKFDIGPFKTKELALREAERLASESRNRRDA